MERTAALDEERSAVTPPPAAQHLLAAHNQLVTAGSVPEHTYVIRAFERLADALELVAPERADDIMRVRQSAVELERSDVSARTHAALVRAGLEAAARALRAADRTDRRDPSSIHALRLTEAALAVANSAAALDPDAPLLDQYGLVRVAIRESTRAVFAALGAADPPVLVHTARR